MYYHTNYLEHTPQFTGMCKLIINASTKKIALKKFAKFSKAKI
jgi:hypothetical protein